MLQEHNTRTSLRAQRRLSLWQQRIKRHSWKSKHLKKINLQYARHWYIMAGWRREWSRGDKREKRRRKRWPFESFHGMCGTTCICWYTGGHWEGEDQKKGRKGYHWLETEVREMFIHNYENKRFNMLLENTEWSSRRLRKLLKSEGERSRKTA